VSRESSGPEPELLDWLARDDHEPGRGWSPEPPLADLHCHPDLVARLAEIARPTGAGRRFVAGCPVIHHPGGRPIAAASGTSWLAVRSALAPGAMRARRPLAAELDPEWVELDPWGADVAFARGIDLLRAHVVQAYERAEAGA